MLFYIKNIHICRELVWQKKRRRRKRDNEYSDILNEDDRNMYSRMSFVQWEIEKP